MAKDETLWETRLQSERASKDSFFRSDPDSPIPPGSRHGFTALRYFPPDPRFRYSTRLVLTDDRSVVTMSVSQGASRRMLRLGYFELAIEEQKVKLWAYVSADEHERTSLFVPFRDGTSGKETYGAGRYLDLPREPSGNYVIDFNESYNPYCAYSENYSCPLPPPENWFKVPIRAGELSYHP